MDGLAKTNRVLGFDAVMARGMAVSWPPACLGLVKGLLDPEPMVLVSQ